MKSDSFVLAFVYCLAAALVLITLEVIVRRSRLSPMVTRRFAHVAAGLFGLIMWGTFTAPAFLTCGIVLLLLISFSYYRRWLTSVHNVQRKTYGEVYLPLGILVTFVISADQPDIFVPSVLVMTFADASAGIIGDIRRKQRPSRLGSIIFYIITAVILLFYTEPVAAIIVAFVITVVEKVSPYGSDNATIPIATALLLSL